MTKLQHNQTLRIALFILAAVTAVLMEPASVNGTVLSSNLIQASSNDNQNALLCPEDISTYTDLNSCAAVISSGLNLEDPDGNIATLSWQLTGATEDHSTNSGINQLKSYAFNEGTTVVTYQGKDRYNNSIYCTFTVTVADNQVPRLETTFENITVEADQGDCNAFVSWPEPLVADNCVSADQILITANYNSGTSFPVGTTEVLYLVSDGVELNDETYQFTVTVTDEEAPEIFAPQAVHIQCGDAVPDALTSWQQFFEAGGMAFDNCNIDYSSFKYAGQKSNGIRCPYTITRTYSIADGYGNVSEVEHLIYVGEEEVVEAEPVVGLKSAMAECTLIHSGNWNVDSIWSCGSAPTSTDNVTIPDGYTVTVDAAAVCQNLTIASGGTLNHGGSLATTLQVYGNWTNNGTYNGGTNGVVEFTGSNPATINGTTNFEGLIVNKGGGLSTTLTINGNVTVLSSGLLTMTSGLVTVPGSSSFTVNPSIGLDIDQFAGFDVTGGSLTTGNFTITNEGLIRISSGSTVSFGTASGNEVHMQTDGAFIVTGGTVDIAGRLYNSAAGTLDPDGLNLTSGISISGGIITLATAGNGLSSTGSLHVTSAGNFDFTGGTIVFENPSTASTELDLGLIDGGGTKNTTGGTFQFGNASTPAGSTFNISSEIALDRITSSANADLVLESDLLVNDLALNSATTIDLNGNALQLGVTGTGIYTFPISDASGNSIPVVVNLSSASSFTSAYIEVLTTDSKHSSNQNITSYFDRFWELNFVGIASPGYSLDANFTNGDLVNGPSNLVVGSYASGWSRISGATIGGNSLNLSNTSSSLVFTALDAPTVSITNVEPVEICYGDAVTINTTASADPVASYSWNPTLNLDLTDPANPVASPLSTTTYTVTLTDGNGLTATDNITVNVNPQLTTTGIESKAVSCFGGTDGEATVTPSGGSAPYTITPTPTGLIAGTHTFTVTDDNGCTTTVDVTITQPAAALTATGVESLAVSCFGGNDGEATITPSGGTLPYTITPAQTGLSAGTHTFTVTDDNGCTTSVDVTITQPAVALTATGVESQAVSCFGGNDGEATINPSGGTSPYTITPAQTGLTAGTHTFTVTDDNGCTTTVDVTITQPAAALTATGVESQAVSCFGGNDGEATITPSGGTLPYTITPAQTGLTAGTHTFTVTDANGCTTTVDVTITQPAAALTATGVESQAVSCFGGNDGEATITPSGGTLPYTITPAQTGLTAGTHTFTVTDANGCTTTVDVTITQPAAALTATGVESQAVSCFGGNDGEATITPSGGTLPYTITPAQIGLSAGTYTFMVADANGCTTTVNVTITQPAAALTATGVESQAVSCFGGNDGEATITPSGGTLPYTITPAQTGLTAGTHTFTVTDANGCTTTVDVTITQPAASLLISLTSQNDVICSYDSDGAIDITVSGGTPGYSYFWTTTGGSGLSATAEDQSGLTAGTYTVVVTDANNCSATTTIIIDITDSEAPVITCPGDISIGTDDGVCNAFVTLDPATATDNCINDVVITNNGTGSDDAYASGTYAVGTTTITFAATDYNNSSTCTTRVTVYDDEGPVITDCPVQTTVVVYNNPGTCFGNATWTEPTKPSSDNCTNNKNQISWSEPSQNPGDLFPFPVGKTTLEYIAGDPSGNFTVCAIDIIVLDGDDPVISNCPANIVESVEPGECYAIVDWTAPTATDGCSDVTTLLSNFSPLDTFYTGTTTVTYTATDTSGNEEACLFTVTVADNEAPVIAGCPVDITQDNDAGECDAVVTWAEPTATDNCTSEAALIWTKSHSPGDVFPIGTTTVNYSVEDAVGNTSLVCSFDVIINDAEPAVLTAPADITVSATANQCNASVTLPFAVFTDNCPSQNSMANSYNGGGRNASDVYPVGTTQVIYTITDFNGTVLRDTTLVTVADDEKPVLNCPGNITVAAANNSCEANVSVVANYTDNCAVDTIYNDFNNGGANAGGQYLVGTTTVTFTAVDASGNTSTCSVNVTVLDNQDPEITCPANISQNVDAGGCTAFVSVPLPTTTDNCAVDTVYNDYNSGGGDASDTYSIGTTTVIYTVLDESGNATTCSMNITIKDSIAPEINCPGDVTQTADPGECQANVTGLIATLAGDNCNDGTITNDYNSGGANASGVYPVGTTAVLFTATDAAGNTDTCSVKVTITDDEAPTPDVAALNDVWGDVCETTTVNAPTATDNCDGVVTAYTDSTATFDAVGDYLITWVYVSNDDTTRQDQNVYIRSAGPPTPDDDNLPTVTGQCEATIAPPYPKAKSSCNANVDGVNLDPLTYTTQGTHIVTWMYATASDTTYQTQVVIVKDTEDPVITCPAAVNTYAGIDSCEAYVAFDTASATDNCLPFTITNNYTTGGSDASGIYPIGSTTVTYTATDSVGNFSTCTVDITVIDSQAPEVTCPGDIEVAANSSGGCDANISGIVATATDNCSVAGITNSYNNGGSNAGGIYPLGTTSVTFYAYDAEGNVDSCSFNVTVTDTVPPQINCPANVQVPNDPDECYAIVSLSEVTSVGDCSEVIITNDYNNGGANASDTFYLGTTTITFSVSDTAGNTGNTCSFDVTVYDSEAPEPFTIAPIFSQCAVSPDPPIAIDNCNDTIWGTTPVEFPYGVTGTSQITWTFIDSAGNYSTELQNVSILDNTSPVWDDPNFFVSSLNRECHEDLSPTATGIPTATDNCALASVIWQDSIITAIAGNCPGNYRIERKWTATDSTGNFRSDIQTINVSDNTDPVIICHDTTVPDPNGIWAPDILRGIELYDNCGIDTIFLVDEYYKFNDDGVAGFCPDTVWREYIVYDQCGRTSNCTQVIAVASPGDCQVCQDTVPYRLADLNGAPDSLWVLDEKFLTREGACCTHVDGNTAWGCMSFNVYLDEHAVGLIFDVKNPAPSGVEYYRVDCGPLVPLGGLICLAGGQFYTVTFCKPGEDKPIYSIQSVAGAITTDSLTTRADVECFGDLHVTGLIPSTINWSVKYPVGRDDLLRYLDTTDIENPVFRPDSVTPALIVYEVCGDLIGNPECDGEPMPPACGDVVVNVLPPVKINLDVDLTTICSDDIPSINAELPFEDPSLEYSFQWYDGPDGTGTVVSTLRGYQPPGEGTYSVVVTEITSGVGCSSDLTNFNIAFDTTGPVLLLPPDTLFLDCSQSDFETVIVNWITTAQAFEYADSTASIEVFNNYLAFTPSCGHSEPIYFWAYDICGNQTLDSAYIVIQDDIAPIIQIEASDQIVDCNALDKNSHPDYIAWLDNHGGATATDDCEQPDSLIWTNDAADQIWVGNGARDSITVTFTVADKCGNSDQTTATFTIIDDVPPVITCPGDFEDIIAQDSCSVSTLDLDSVFAVDQCSEPTLEWIMTGATVGSGTGQVIDELFNVGQTTVHYTAIDGAGLTDTCSFVVWVKHLNPPTSNITCPTDSVWAVADADCYADVLLDTVGWVDPCNELDSIWNNSPYRTSASDASGRYPIGVTDFTWYILDVSDNIDSCNVTVIVDDETAPYFLTCPNDTLEDIVDPLECDITDFNLVAPTWEVGCGADLRWELSGATTGSGTDVIDPSVVAFNVGITTITYILEDPSGNADTCIFWAWAKHVDFPTSNITCPTDSVWAQADPTSCDIYVPLDTVEWIDPCNELDSIWNNSPFRTSASDASGTYPIGVHDFTWYILDVSDNIDSCNVTVIVEDVDAPQFLTCPNDTLEDIVDPLECDIADFNLDDPTWDVGCGADLRWELSGATSGNGIDLIDPSVVTFNVGITTITYILEDPAGNADTCIFWAWAKHVDFPTSNITCPTDSIWATADPLSCDVFVPLDTVIWTDPCNEIDSIWNDSPYRTSPSDASGTYPIGVHDFTWYILDVSKNIVTCDVTVIVEDITAPQFLTCPQDTMVDIVDPVECDIDNFDLVDPTWNVGCGADLRWELSGATTGSGTGLIDPSVVLFNVGITDILYILEDPSGNADSCSMVAWAKHVDFPTTTLTCPPASVTETVDPDFCDKYVTLDTVVWTDPCNELDSIWNNSPYRTSPSDASGDYPIGVTPFTWYITDVSGNIDSCNVTVTILDLMPVLDCPDDITDQADFDKPYASGIDVPIPYFYDNCDSILTWTVSGATSFAELETDTLEDGIYVVHSPDTFNIGTTTIHYRFEDGHGNWDSCSFNIIVTGPPEIECPPSDTLYLDNSGCTYPFYPDEATLIEGVQPIDWTWTLENPDGSTITGSSRTPDDGPDPLPIVSAPPNEYDFELGTTTITWTAKNVSGADTCGHHILVLDTVPPTLDADPYTDCVDMIEFAIYNPTNPNPEYHQTDPNLEKSPSPDYSTFYAGETYLDLTSLEDNCCDSLSMVNNLEWRIDFVNTIHPITGAAIVNPSISGTGQPSTYGSNIPLWGDGVDYTTLVHSITYWVTDCNGNLSEEIVRPLTITPRPQIIKQN
ncbi:HYR domain-containing protein [Prolixibacteraceae bacterium Z1-6]|uniref:HYR domain-containing protein n=1 Tax=Draconibacterium aestuarii TaxID=2998507 RepID=A0A9X3F7B8_9BACT|nr:HYR domain-containing protein [Prolixibacteraceae bacterium Z1-6]